MYHLLAYHYGQSADSAKAIAYLPHLFQKAGQNCTLPDVVAALERALEHAARLPAGMKPFPRFSGLDLDAAGWCAVTCGGMTASSGASIALTRSSTPRTRSISTG